MTKMSDLCAQIKKRYANWIDSAGITNVKTASELTVVVKPMHLLALCHVLYNEPEFDFKMLIDICGVDYLHYGLDDWQTQSTTETGFGRGVTLDRIRENPGKPNRYAVVYHLLSLTKNHRIRLQVNLPNEKELLVDSVMAIWPAADWFEREAFDLFGILFRGHPDLRRLLTDYGFTGHPFRKDFPLIGKVEARYDAKLRRVVYEPVSIELRILEPKVIRHDNRYARERKE